MDEQFNENTITAGDVFSVLFGRKKLYLILAAVSLLIGVGATYILRRSNSSYVSLFNYNTVGLKDGKYFDGTKFDIRELVTLEKLEQYKEENDALKNLDMEDLYYNGVVKSLDWVTIYKQNDTKLTENDYDYLVDKTGFQLELDASYLTKVEAAALARAIAEEPNAIMQKKLEDVTYNINLTLAHNSSVYENKLNYLESQYNFLQSKYDSLIESYGDVVLANTQKLSDVKLQIADFFKNHSFGDMSDELKVKGYVYNPELYLADLNAQLDYYKVQKEFTENKLDALVAQRNDLLNQIAAGTSTVYSLDLSAYDSQIVENTINLEAINEQIKILETKIKNQDALTRDADYVANMEAFEAKLGEFETVLTTYTTDYIAVEKEVLTEYSTVYYDNNAIVTKVSNSSLLTPLALTVVVAIFLPMIVNLFLDGKKIFKTDVYKNDVAIEEKEKENK